MCLAYASWVLAQQFPGIAVWLDMYHDVVRLAMVDLDRKIDLALMHNSGDKKMWWLYICAVEGKLERNKNKVHFLLWWLGLVLAITTFIGSYWTLERWPKFWGMLANSATTHYYWKWLMMMPCDGCDLIFCAFCLMKFISLTKQLQYHDVRFGETCMQISSMTCDRPYVVAIKQLSFWVQGFCTFVRLKGTKIRQSCQMSS